MTPLDNKGEWRAIGCMFIFGLSLVALLWLLVGCKTRYITTEVPVPIEHTIEHNNVSIQRDTLLMRDSVFHYINGDTIRIEKWHTLYNVRVDTIHDVKAEVKEVPVEVTKTEIKEVNRLHWWQKALMWLAVSGIAFIIIRYRKTLYKVLHSFFS